MKLIGSKKGIHTPELHRRKQKIRKIKLSLYGVLAFLILVAPFIILRSSKLQIAHIALSGNEVAKTDALQSIVAKDISGDYMWVVPRSSALFYPKQKILADLLASDPRLDTATLKLGDVHTLAVAVEERTPAALYCTDVSHPEAPTGCYLADASGFIFAPAPTFSGGVYSVYSSKPVLTDPLKHSILPPDAFKTMGNFLKSLSQIPLTPLALSLGDEDDLYLAEGPTVIWNSDQDLATVYQNLAAFVGDPTIKKAGIGALSYIDLRVESKVFYKFNTE